MKKKLILSLALIFFILVFYNKKIIEFVLAKKLSSWTEYSSNLNLSKLNFFSGQIEVKDIIIRNKVNFFNKNIFEASHIKIDLDNKTFFSDLVVIKNVVLQSPKFYFEIKNLINDDKKIEDNLELIDRISKNQPPKIYPKKNKDKNFIIINLRINNAIVFIKDEKNKENIEIPLSNMNFNKIGNSGHFDPEFQHYKNVMKIILYDTFFRIPDDNLRKFIKKKYKIQ